MRRYTALLAALLPLAAAAGPSEDAAARKKIEADRADTMRWLRSDPTSYLAAVKRVSFGDKAELVVGSDPACDLVLPGLEPRHLRVTAGADGFAVRALDAGAFFTVGKGTAPVREAGGGPTRLSAGRFHLRLSHQGYPAVIVFDPKSPRFKEYKGIPYFPIDLSRRVRARLVPDPKAETVALASSNSGDRRAQRVGWLEFTLGKTALRLAAHRLLEPGSGDDDVSVFFRDATTGKESYMVGRYVEPEKQGDGSYILDFNMAYNPACAYSGFYNCPIPPKENQLPVAVRAGERDPHYQH
ncbi:MAG: DUF1684 domain-containing protein [Elusimicrobia bacterium]|nr:DUF1684 domain-containing protein [Elusimicrobiota bacterium]